MIITTKSDYKLFGVGYGKTAFFPQGEYEATPATSIPDWKEKGKVFISNGYCDLLLEYSDYTKEGAE